jgi:hypothetical protein
MVLIKVDYHLTEIFGQLIRFLGRPDGSIHVSIDFQPDSFGYWETRGRWMLKAPYPKFGDVCNENKVILRGTGRQIDVLEADVSDALCKLTVGYGPQDWNFHQCKVGEWQFTDIAWINARQQLCFVARPPVWYDQ